MYALLILSIMGEIDEWNLMNLVVPDFKMANINKMKLIFLPISKVSYFILFYFY